MNIFRTSLTQSISRKRCSVKMLLVLFLVMSFTVSPLGVEVVFAESFIDRITGTFLGAVSEIADNTFGLAFRGITWVIFEISGWLTSASGTLLDVAITFSLDTSNYRDLGGLRVAWEIFRDLANLSFIFILLYIAASIILQINASQARKMLATLIVVAFLVNFSFFITGFVIDIGNVLGGFLYRAITPVVNGEQITIGGNLIEGLKLTTIVDEDNLSDMSFTQEGIVLLLGSIVLLVAAFTFIAGAMLFILRTVVLMFMLFLSPIAFVALILPKTQKYWSMWIGKLMGNTLVAPIYLLLITVVILIIRSDQLEIKTKVSEDLGGGATAAASNQTFSAMLHYTRDNYVFSEHTGIILNYIIIIGLLVATLSVSKNVADGIGNLSMKWAGKFTSASASAAAFTGRHTLGRGMAAVADSGFLQGQAGKKGFGGYAARQAIKLTDYGARARYDVRAGATGKAIGATAGGALAAGGIKVDAGKPKKENEGGYRKIQSNRTKERKRKAGLFKREAAKQRFAEDVQRRRGVYFTKNAQDQERINKIRESFNKTPEERRKEAVLDAIRESGIEGEIRDRVSADVASSAPSSGGGESSTT